MYVYRYACMDIFSASMFIILNIVKSRVIWVQQLKGTQNKTPRKLLKFLIRIKSEDVVIYKLCSYQYTNAQRKVPSSSLYRGSPVVSLLKNAKTVSLCYKLGVN